MRKGLTFGAVALVLLLGAACGARPNAQPRYLYYPARGTSASQDTAPVDTLPAGNDDPTPVDYVNAAPAVAAPQPVPPAPVSAGFGAPNAIGRIEIPKIGLIQPMFEGVSLDVLAQGPGHWTGTPMPGDTGNVVVAGHRVTHTHPFLDIDQLLPGDQVIFTTTAGRFVYAVTQSFIVTPDAVWIANPTSGPTMTLFACHPKHQATHRIVVTGNLVSAQRTAPPPSAPAPATPAPPQPTPPAPPAPPPASPPPPASTPSTSPPDTQPSCTAWICLFGR
ncbi:MAG: class E sortase [Acidimicrobiia bacterium]|nr:class E sortase [Acidimicrobiia bacterium]